MAQIDDHWLSGLSTALTQCSAVHEKIEKLDRNPRVVKWLKSSEESACLCNALGQEYELAVKSLVAIGQEQLLFKEGDRYSITKIGALLNDLLPVESFYREIGGIVGYHRTMLSLLDPAPSCKGQGGEAFYRPPGFDISEESDAVRRYVLEGILSLPFLAEMYPVGGSADRLRLLDPQTGDPLPAAKLPFGGRSLLEGLIRDVEAKEYLYFKLFGEQVLTPIAMMTSHEKHNHQQILSICEEKGWFGRPRESFLFFRQPVVPTIDRQGEWCLAEPMQLMMRPGGHGVIWKAAQDQSVFDWLEKQGRKKLLVRQINNPIAGTDYGILAFCGIGFGEKKLFGFASCPRQVRSAEGMNVLIEKKDPSSFSYCLTNIEYCDFKKYGIEDVPVNAESTYSQYPSNTNILFADIAAIREKVSLCPIPGMLVNLKSMAAVDVFGNPVEKEIARLESTMQNIADCFVEESLEPLSLESDAATMPLQTFLTYHDRLKTISTTKKEYLPGGSLLETPEGCFYDQLQNARALLVSNCGISVPPLQSQEEYIKNGPSFIFRYHPVLGPLYSVVGQKLRGGIFHANSELSLEIAQARIAQLDLSGSLLINADRPTRGDADIYANEVGRCQLINVVVRNAGIDRTVDNVYWKDCVARKERCEILLHGNGEFFAENVTLTGDVRIEVEPNTRVTASESEGKLQLRRESIHKPSWDWIYHISDEGKIELEYIAVQ